MSENVPEMNGAELAKGIYKAEVLLLENGVAHTRSARVLSVSPSGAWVEVANPVHDGQKLGLVIQSSESGFLRMFGLGGAEKSPPATVKTQGIVNEIQDSDSSKPDVCMAHILFTGNIRVVSAG